MSTLVPNRDKPCKSGIHLWRMQQDADRCCAGWIPVRVPVEFRYRLDEWAETPPLPFHDARSPWIRVLVPENQPELIEALRLREPDAFRSSTGPVSPWLKLPV